MIGIIFSHAAYIGPGVGLSAVGVVWVLLASVGAAVGVLLLWPVRVVWRKLKKHWRARGSGAGGSDQGA